MVGHGVSRAVRRRHDRRDDVDHGRHRRCRRVCDEALFASRALAAIGLWPFEPRLRAVSGLSDCGRRRADHGGSERRVTAVTGRRFSEWAGFGCMGRLRRFLFSLTVPLILSVSPAQSHDPSAWGGLFRSRNDGATWMSANRGYYLSGAIALAVSPTDPNHLLLGSETGLFRSHNGGRHWAVAAPSVVVGSVFAAAFAADGRRALISTGLAVFRSEEENHWQLVRAPQGAAPARAIVPSGEVGGFYLAGWTGLYRSGDGGVTWSSVADRFPHEAATALLAVRGPPEAFYAIVQGRPWVSVDGAR